MENLLNQMRVKFTGAEEDKAGLGVSGDLKVPIQKTQSFKEKKKAQNWFQKLFARKTSPDYDSTGMEHAAAVAAAAFAINLKESFEQKSDTPEASLTKTRSKVDGTKSPISLLGSASKRFSGSFKYKDDQVKKEPISSVTDEGFITLTPSMKRTSTLSDKKPKAPPPPPPPPPPPIRQTSTPTTGTERQTPTRPSIGETKADEWERTELEKIRERYDQLKETIDSWENKKKTKAKYKLNKEESKLEQRRLKALESFRIKMTCIEQIARGARDKAEKSRKNEELKANEKANVIRTTGKLPGIFFCF